MFFTHTLSVCICVCVCKEWSERFTKIIYCIIFYFSWFRKKKKFGLTVSIYCVPSIIRIVYIMMFYFIIWTTATNLLSFTLSLTVCHSVYLSVYLHLSLRVSKSLDARHSGGRSSPWISVQGIFILLLFSRNAQIAHAPLVLYPT